MSADNFVYPKEEHKVYEEDFCFVWMFTKGKCSRERGEKIQSLVYVKRICCINWLHV